MEPPISPTPMIAIRLKKAIYLLKELQ